MTSEETHIECFVCLSDTNIQSAFVILNCCKVHQIHKYCLYNLFLYFLNDTTKPDFIECPICRSSIYFKDFFTIDECKLYFSKFDDDYQKRFIKKQNYILRTIFNQVIIDIDTATYYSQNTSITRSITLSYKDIIYTIVIIVLIILLIFILTSIN